MSTLKEIFDAHDGEYRIGVGMYRIRYTVQDDIVTVSVFKIGHRKDVYE